MAWNVPPAPPQHFGHGGGNPNIFPVDDNYDQRGNAGIYRGNDLDDLEELLEGVKVGGTKPGKTKKKDKQIDDEDKKEKKPPKPVEIRYEGYALSKLNPTQGEKSTWSKVGKRLLPVDGDVLHTKAIQHQRSTGLSALAYFERLSAEQQGIINRIIAEKNLREKDVNADWILYDVKKLEKDVQVSFWRMGRTVVALRVIIKRQDKLPTSSKKLNTVADYDFGEIIDLSVPLKVSKEGKDGKDGNNSSKDKKKNKKGNTGSDLDDEILASISQDPPPADQYRQNNHAHQQQQPPLDPFAGQGQQYQDQRHQHQPPQPQFQDLFPPQNHHPNDGHHPDPFANVPQGAIPVPQEHQHPQYDHIPPQAPMAPHTNPFHPEVPGVPEQWDLPPQMSQVYPQPESRYGAARITTRERSHSRAREDLERQLEREREEVDRLREASRNRRERETEERLARSRSRQRKASEERRRLAEDNRRLRDRVASVEEKVNVWQGSAESSSATSGGDRDDFWDRPRSPRYSTPGTSPDRNPRRGSLHRRKSSDPRNVKYYQDRRSSRYPHEAATIMPEYTHRRDPREYDRGRRLPSDVGFSPPPRPRAVQTHSYDDYPRQQARYVEPRYAPPTRRLTEYSDTFPDADFDRRGGGGVGVDYLRHEPRRQSRRYDRYDREPLYNERRARRASTYYG